MGRAGVRRIINTKPAEDQERKFSRECALRRLVWRLAFGLQPPYQPEDRWTERRPGTERRKATASLGRGRSASTGTSGHCPLYRVPFPAKDGTARAKPIYQVRAGTARTDTFHFHRALARALRKQGPCQRGHLSASAERERSGMEAVVHM